MKWIFEIFKKYCVLDWFHRRVFDLSQQFNSDKTEYNQSVSPVFFLCLCAVFTFFWFQIKRRL